MSSSAGSSTNTQKPQQPFEFTKRKRWADLLVTELADAIIFILSSTCKVLYCGTAVNELLGWRDVDLIDGDLINLIDFDDRVRFRTSFDESIRERNDLLSYVQLKYNLNHTLTYPENAREILFEIRGYPHFVPDDQLECDCFIAMARPYPSRNTATLNTFLELKMKNEQLQQRLLDLKASAAQTSLPNGHPLDSNPIYGTSSTLPPRTLPSPMVIPSQRPIEPQNAYYAPQNLNQGGFDDMQHVTGRSSFDGTSYGGGTLYGPNSVSSNTDDDSVEDGLKKKKLKKTHVPEQYVCITCGRTDSPEWRKGPLGPKTLCNACGLRWAKQMRKYDDPTEVGEGSAISLT